MKYQESKMDEIRTKARRKLEILRKQTANLTKAELQELEHMHGN